MSAKDGVEGGGKRRTQSHSSPHSLPSLPSAHGSLMQKQLSKRFEKINVVVVGEPESQKGQLIGSFLAGRGTDNEPAGPAKGLARMVALEDHSLYKVSITTNLGLERTYGHLESAIRAAHGVIFVYHVASRKSFLAFEQWREARADTDKGLPAVLLVGLIPPKPAAPDFSAHATAGPLAGTDSSAGVVLKRSSQALQLGTAVTAAGGAGGLPGRENSPSPTKIRRHSRGSGSFYLSGGFPVATPAPTSPVSSPTLFGSPSLRAMTTEGHGAVRAVTAEEAQQLAEAYGFSSKEVDLSSAPDPTSPSTDPYTQLFARLIRNIRKDSSVGSKDEAVEADKHVIDIMVVGDSMAGKTAMLQKLLHGAFPPQYAATLASEGRLYKHRVSIDGQLRTLRIRDTSGTAGIEGIAQAQLIGTHGVLFVFDTNDKQSMQRMEGYYKHIQGLRQDKKLAALLVGNKTDLPSSSPLYTRQISVDEANKYAARWKLQYSDFSAKTGDVVSDIFKPLVREVLRVFEFGRSSSFVCEQSGFLSVAKTGSQKLKRKWVVLRNGHVSIWKAADDKKPKTDHEITLDSSITDVPVLDDAQAEKQGYPFTLKLGKKTLTLASQTAAERALWVSAFTTETAIQRAAADIFEDCAKEVAKQFLPLMPLPAAPVSATHDEAKRRRSVITPPGLNLEAMKKGK